MAIAPIRIQSPINAHREMIAFAHRARAQRDKASRPGILMFNPFGQEGVRTHRLMRVLADRLARVGHDVLRFDYHGTGDSPGDDQIASLGHFVEDSIAAASTLAAMTHAKSFTWLGIRLGASVALKAAQQSSLLSAYQPNHLVLWEPVLDGEAHLKALSADHHRALLSAYSLPAHAKRLVRSHQQVWPPTELIGFEVSAQMTQEIGTLTGKTLAVNTPHISLAVSPIDSCQANASNQPANPKHEATWRVTCEQAGTQFSHYPASVDFDWTSEEALNTALVPAPAVAAIIDAITATATPGRPAEAA
ncbi:MAG: alpha/beta hydrolase [Burkholderiaceae bacterium]